MYTQESVRKILEALTSIANCQKKVNGDTVDVARKALEEWKGIKELSQDEEPIDLSIAERLINDAESFRYTRQEMLNNAAKYLGGEIVKTTWEIVFMDNSKVEITQFVDGNGETNEIIREL